MQGGGGGIHMIHARNCNLRRPELGDSDLSLSDLHTISLHLTTKETPAPEWARGRQQQIEEERKGEECERCTVNQVDERERLLLSRSNNSDKIGIGRERRQTNYLAFVNWKL